MMNIWIECETCEGTGMTKDYSGSGGCLGSSPCMDCDGTGEVRHTYEEMKQRIAELEGQLKRIETVSNNYIERNKPLQDSTWDTDRETFLRCVKTIIEMVEE